MAKTKQQKIDAVETGLAELKGSEILVFTDFTGLSVNELNSFRRALRNMGGIFRVIKKRLLKIILEKTNISLDPKSFEGQMGVVFSSKDIVDTAGAVYQFVKLNEKLKVLGGFDLKGNKLIEANDIKRIGQLPSREVLLGQLVGLLTVPIRQFLFVLNEKAKRSL